MLSNKKLIYCVGVFLVVSTGSFVAYEYNRPRMIDYDKTSPMMIFKNKDKLWQVVTYDGEPVTTLMTRIHPEFSQEYRNVYLNYRSQFVFSDGTGITVEEQPIYWNRAGDIVTIDYTQVNESYIFWVGDKEMRTNTAITLAGLKKQVLSDILKSKDIDRNRMSQKVGSRSEWLD